MKPLRLWFLNGLAQNSDLPIVRVEEDLGVRHQHRRAGERAGRRHDRHDVCGARRGPGRTAGGRRGAGHRSGRRRTRTRVRASSASSIRSSQSANGTRRLGGGLPQRRRLYGGGPTQRQRCSSRRGRPTRRRFRSRRRIAGRGVAARDRPPRRQAVHRPHQPPETRPLSPQDQENDSRRCAHGNAKARRRHLLTACMVPASRYRVVFFGTPDFAVPSLRALLAGPDEVVVVVCQPDRPAGRGQQLRPPPVKSACAEPCGAGAAATEAAQRGLRNVPCERGLRTSAWSPPTAAFCRARFSSCRGSVASTSMRRCCRNTGARRRSNGRFCGARRRPG